MATEIRMPQLSDTMDSGKIINWFKNEGDSIDRGDILAEVETDKANLEIESFHQGTLLKIITPAEQSAAVGDVIAYIGEAGEAVPSGSASQSETAEPPSDSSKQSNETAVQAHEQNGNGKANFSAHAQTPQSSDSLSGGVSLGARESQPSDQESKRIKASPLARKMAEAHNLDLARLSGSGPDGRVVKRDVEKAVETAGGPAERSPAQVPVSGEQPMAKTVAAEAPSQRGSGSTGPVLGSLEPMSKMRNTIAVRMQQSVTEAPHFYVTASIDMSEALRTRSKLKELPQFEGLSVNHFILKAAAYGIRKEPRVNRAVRDGNMIFTPGEINIGIITAIEDGLLIPVLRQVDQMSLVDVVVEARGAVQRARAGKPSSTDLTGGTFSISNMGMFDVENFTAIINPGQGSVLAVSSIRDEPVVLNGQITIGQRMKATISVDHRIIDGVMAGNFLAAFTEALETPALLMV